MELREWGFQECFIKGADNAGVCPRSHSFNLLPSQNKGAKLDYTTATAKND